jgi:hypothetical protein
LANKATETVDWRAFLLDDKKRSRLLGKSGR